ncbi:UNVERIFIED_ORG: hypothetical protein ABIC97_004123 [Peribacillus simplex]
MTEKDVTKALKLYGDRESKRLSVNDIVKMTGVPRLGDLAPFLLHNFSSLHNTYYRML